MMQTYSAAMTVQWLFGGVWHWHWRLAVALKCRGPGTAERALQSTIVASLACLEMMSHCQKSGHREPCALALVWLPGDRCFFRGLQSGQQDGEGKTLGLLIWTDAIAPAGFERLNGLQSCFRMQRSGDCNDVSSTPRRRVYNLQLIGVQAPVVAVIFSLQWPHAWRHCKAAR